jgi:hypothetical protein
MAALVKIVEGHIPIVGDIGDEVEPKHCHV